MRFHVLASSQAKTQAGKDDAQGTSTDRSMQPRLVALDVCVERRACGGIWAVTQVSKVLKKAALGGAGSFFAAFDSHP